MKSTLKRILSFVFAAIIMSSTQFYALANNQEIASDNNTDNVIIEDADEFSDKIDLIADADVVTVDALSIEQQDTELVQEVLDNGTDLLVIGDDIDKLSDIADISVEQSETDAVKAAYISNQNGENSLSLVCYEPVYDIDENVSNDEYVQDIDELRDIDVFNSGQIADDMNNATDTEIENFGVQNKDSLKSFGSVINGCYLSAGKHYYFMKKGSAGGVSTNYKWYASNSNVNTKTFSGDKYSTIGAIDIRLVCKKVKDIKTTSYDRIFACVQASAIDNKLVDSFKFSFINNSTSKSKIINASKLKSNSNKTCTTTIGTTVSSDGKTCVTSSSSYSYSCDSIDIISQFTQAATKTWSVSSNSAKYGQTYEIQPNIVVETKQGASNKCSITGKCTYLKLYGGVRYYTINSPCSVTVSFKNHKAA